MTLSKRKKIVLIATVLIELIIGSVFLFHVYRQRTAFKLPESDKITVIKKENLIFPEESEYKYYYELKPNIKIVDSTDWLGYEATYIHNADGLNERFDYEIEKPANTFRIITLGDSFTYGQFVNTEDNWTERLEDILNINQKNKTKFEVINLGVGGFDVPYLVKRYKDIGAKYNPDLIIWFESGEGFYRMVELIRPIADTCENEVSENDKKKEFHYYCWARAGERLAEKYSDAEVGNLIMDELDSLFLSLKNGEDFIFFTYQEDSLGETKLHALRQWEGRFATFPNVTFASVVPGIYNLQQSLPDGHSTVKGHQIMANAIYEYLTSNVINRLE